MREARLQNLFVGAEFEKSESWRNNVKFLKNQVKKNDISNNSNLKNLSLQIEENCDILGKLIAVELQKRDNENNRKFVSMNEGKISNLQIQIEQYQSEIAMIKIEKEKLEKKQTIIHQSEVEQNMVKKEMIKLDIGNANNQYIEANNVLSEKIRNHFNHLEREKKQQNELKLLEAEVQKRINQTKTLDAEANQSMSFMIEQRIKLLESENKSFNKSLRDFLQENFPKVQRNEKEQSLEAYYNSKKDIKKVKKDEEKEKEYYSMAHILQVLMNRFTLHPENPYIDIAPLHWEPYINLLIEHGIAEKNSNGNQVMICSFK